VASARRMRMRRKLREGERWESTAGMAPRGAPPQRGGGHKLWCLSPTLSYLKAPFFAQSSVRCLESEF